MSSRVAGAGLALIAAALFAVSIATPVVLPAQLSLFAGHPTVNGHTLEMQDVYVGFYGAELCNTGGDGTCRSRDPKNAFKIAALAELGVTGLLGASAFVLALLTLRKSERRKGAAWLVRVLAVIGAGGAGALVVLGPTDQGSIPIGLGMAIYGAGVLGVLLASVIAARRPPPIKLRVADRASQPVAELPAPQPFDMQALFGDDQRHPAERGPEPKRWGARPEPPPGPGELDESENPFEISQPGGDGPLFASAPQLRPLYDATPLQGGTGGLIPIERPVMPAHPPAPLPRASISAVAGIPTTPPPFPAERPKTLPPPNFGARAKPSSIAPPIPPGASPRTQVSLVPPMPDKDVAIEPPSPPPVPPPAPPAPPPPPAPADSDGSPEASGPSPNTEPNLFPAIETPLAPPPMPNAPTPRPRVETPLAPPPLPVAPPPRPARESQAPPRPQRETQSPRPGIRAAVPMPARPGRQTASPTRPPPLSIPGPRGAPPRPAIAVLPPSIPAIPAIPAIPMLAHRAATDPQERATTVDQALDPPTGSRIPVEIGDHTSQTHVSFGMVTAEELAAAVDEFIVPHDAPGDVHGEATTAGDPVDDLGDAAGATDPGSAPAPAAAPSLPPPPVLVAPLPVTPVARERPMPKLPISTAPDSLPPPKDTKQQSGPSPACPQCESPMAWVEEHLRFYCKSCRMYF